MTDWIVADWPAPDRIVAGTTTREGGVSKGVYASLNLGAHVGDNSAAVSGNRRRFLESSGLDAEPGWLNQVHGTNVQVVGEATLHEADAVVSRGEPVAVLTADCLPILLCAMDGSEFAAVHGGWRGLAAGIVTATLAKMNTHPGDLLAWLGPAISRNAFEVGGEVRDAFVSQVAAARDAFVPNERNRWQADLYLLARLQLEAAGLQSISGGSWCTYGEADRFFSYRRDGQCGRMATFVARKKIRSTA